MEYLLVGIVTPQLKTNRDLYLAIDGLSKQHQECSRSLETYLLALIHRSTEFAEREAISLAEFYEMLSYGFTGSPAEFDNAWCDQYDQLPSEDDGYLGWHAIVVRQIVDLHEMDECGTLKSEMRYFGVSAPRNSYWYNFDPRGYLECAIAGSFGGWEPGDETGRGYVPGLVAVLADDGSIQSANPEDVPNPTFEMPFLTWEHFKDFIIVARSTSDVDAL